jgi:hypothetical protein
VNSSLDIELSLAPPDEADLVLSWRIAVLERAGYDTEDMIALAVTREIDLHRCVQIVERGCPPALAARILL